MSFFPSPPTPPDKDKTTHKAVFFENPEMEEMARTYLGNFQK